MLATYFFFHNSSLSQLVTDIIAMPILGILLLVAFLFWQWYLEEHTEQEERHLLPPIMKLST
jgi:hypothetical protein